MRNSITKDRLKVLHLVHALKAGGAERVLVNLCNFASDAVQNIICSFDIPDDFGSLIHASKHDVRCLGKKEGNDWKIVGKIRRLIREEHIDIVHAQGWGTYIEGLLAAKCGYGMRPRLVFAFHGKSIEDVVLGVPVRRRIAQRAAYYWTDAVITPAAHMAQDYGATIGVDFKGIDVIPNGIDLSAFSRPDPDARQRLGISQDAFVVGFVGRLDPVKNLAGLITIMARFCRNLGEESRRAVLMIVGNGPQRHELQALVRDAGLRERVYLMGERNDIGACLSAMDVYIQPSFYEGHSLTIIEAMAAGLPVISTKVGGTPEIITDGVSGLLFDPADLTGMVQALEHIHHAPRTFSTLGTAGQSHVKERFSVQHMVKSYEALYRRLAGLAARA